MTTYKEKVFEAAEYLKRGIQTPVEVGVMTGTGLGESVGNLENINSFDYSQIPNFPKSTVQSHYGRLISGTIEGFGVIAMQGRFHLYEGYTPLEVTFPVRVMQEIGIRTLILTNAAGGLNLNFSPGDLMIIKDHINLTGENPLVGDNENDWGPRFPDMTSVYDPGLADMAERAAKSSAANINRGVYVGLKGPSLETSAETRFLRQIGADAVGFSTVQEAIAAVHAGIKILGLSTITNINDPDNPTTDTEESIIKVAKNTAPKLSEIIQTVVKELAKK